MAEKPTFRLKHIGINHTDEETACIQTQLLAELFDLSRRETQKAIFVGELFEMMRYKGHGTHGHIALAVEDVAQARAYLEAKGQSFLEETARFNADGTLTFIYLKGDFSGFAIHLVAED